MNEHQIYGIALDLSTLTVIELWEHIENLDEIRNIHMPPLKFGGYEDPFDASEINILVAKSRFNRKVVLPEIELRIEKYKLEDIVDKNRILQACVRIFTLPNHILSPVEYAGRVALEH